MYDTLSELATCNSVSYVLVCRWQTDPKIVVKKMKLFHFLVKLCFVVSVIVFCDKNADEIIKL